MATRKKAVKAEEQPKVEESKVEVSKVEVPKTEEPKAPENESTEQTAVAEEAQTIRVVSEDTATRIENIEDIVNRLSNTVAENAANIKKNTALFESRLNLTKNYAINLGDQLTEILKQQSQQAGIIKDLNDRLTAMEEREQTARKTRAEFLNRINTRFQSLEHPKTEVIEIKPLVAGESYVVPSPAKDGSIGDDLYTIKDIWVEHGRNVVPLGICINLPRGIEGKIEPRSGFSVRGIWAKSIQYVSDRIFWFIHKPAVEVTVEGNMDADVINGKIDPGYHDGIGVIIKNHGVPFVIPAGTRIAQITYYKTANHHYKKVEEFSNEAPYVADRNGGFGSSNKQ